MVVFRGESNFSCSNPPPRVNPTRQWDGLFRGIIYLIPCLLFQKFQKLSAAYNKLTKDEENDEDDAVSQT